MFLDLLPKLYLRYDSLKSNNIRSSETSHSKFPIMDERKVKGRDRELESVGEVTN